MKPTRANGLPIPRTLRLWFAVFRLLQAKEMVEQTDMKSGWVRTQRWTEYKTAARAAGELIDHRHRSGVVVFFAAELLFFRLGSLFLPSSFHSAGSSREMKAFFFFS